MRTLRTGRHRPQGPLQPGGDLGGRRLQQGVAVGRGQRETDDALRVHLGRPDPYVTVTARPEHPLYDQLAGEGPVDGGVGTDVEADVHGVGVLGAVAQPGGDGDAALRRQHQLELQFTFDHGMHGVRSSPCTYARRRAVQGESALPGFHYAGFEDDLPMTGKWSKQQDRSDAMRRSDRCGAFKPTAVRRPVGLNCGSQGDTGPR